MPKLSDKTIEKIKEHILEIVYQNHFNPLFTSEIASEIIRDEEFTLRLLSELKSKKFVLELKKNQKGKNYLRRKRWVLTSPIYSKYGALYG